MNESFDKMAHAKVVSDRRQQHKLDLQVACPVCSAALGERCRNQPKDVVHFGRRLRRLLDGAR